LLRDIPNDATQLPEFLAVAARSSELILFKLSAILSGSFHELEHSQASAARSWMVAGQLVPESPSTKPFEFDLRNDKVFTNL
jgi:hypothetical protein